MINLNDLQVVINEESGCFSFTFKDKEEAFLNFYYDDGFRDDIVISPMDKEDARDFAVILEKLIKRRLKFGGLS